MIWEKICADVLNSKLYDKPFDIAAEYGFSLNEKYKEFDTLLSVIEKPTWTEKPISATAAKTLKPDLISFRKIEDKIEFDIFDAKYYVAQIVPNKVAGQPVKVFGQPGIESIIKQYAYQMAYTEFINDNKIENVNNCFLMPTENTEIGNSEVHLNFMETKNLKGIKVRKLPAKKMYDYYLKSKQIDIGELNL